MDQTTFIPFSEQALNVGRLSIESRADQISLYGSVDITRDQLGLEKARVLQALLVQVITSLEKEALPVSLAILPTENIENPF